MLDLLYSPGGFEVAWDYCLQESICLPDMGLISRYHVRPVMGYPVMGYHGMSSSVYDDRGYSISGNAFSRSWSCVGDLGASGWSSVSQNNMFRSNSNHIY